MKVSHILAKKGHDVHRCTSSDTLRVVVSELSLRGVGALVVVDDGEVVGIISERDIVRALATWHGAMADTVAMHMSSPVVTTTPDAEVGSLAAVMTASHIRHLPVLDGGELVGMISTGDVVVCHMDALDSLAHQLESYVSGGSSTPATVPPMELRDAVAADAEELVRISLEAFAPVHDSLERVLGTTLFAALNPDGWEQSQSRAVADSMVSDRCWVAQCDGEVAGFVCAALRGGGVGEVTLLAVAPDHQGRGVASALLECALGWLVGEGAEVAMVETGGDPGHAAARATYERAGFVQLPVARYFLELGGRAD